MLKRDAIDQLEKLAGQLLGHHEEISALTKKSPNDAVNEFKLKFINKTLENCNKFLGDKYKPFDEFNCFESDNVPSNSDVTFMLSQYMQAIEKLRSDNIFERFDGWFYESKDGDAKIKTAPPAKIKPTKG